MPAALGSSNGAALENSGPGVNVGPDVDARVDVVAASDEGAGVDVDTEVGAGADVAGETVRPATVGLGESPPEHPETNNTAVNAASRAAAAMPRLFRVN